MLVCVGEKSGVDSHWVRMSELMIIIIVIIIFDTIIIFFYGQGSRNASIDLKRFQ